MNEGLKIDMDVKIQKRKPITGLISIVILKLQFKIVKFFILESALEMLPLNNCHMR